MRTKFEISGKEYRSSVIINFTSELAAESLIMVTMTRIEELNGEYWPICF